MGAGTNGHGSVVITNFTDQPIVISSKNLNLLLSDEENSKTHTIHPKDSYVLFTNKIESFSWEKPQPK